MSVGPLAASAIASVIALAVFALISFGVSQLPTHPDAFSSETILASSVVQNVGAGLVFGARLALIGSVFLAILVIPIGMAFSQEVTRTNRNRRKWVSAFVGAGLAPALFGLFGWLFIVSMAMSPSGVCVLLGVVLHLLVSGGIAGFAAACAFDAFDRSRPNLPTPAS